MEQLIERRVPILKGIATGMKWLHSNNFVHLDLTTMNIMLDDEWEPKISDFGLTVNLNSNPGRSCFNAGTASWRAPETYPSSNPNSTGRLKNSSLTNPRARSVDSSKKKVKSGKNVPRASKSDSKENLEETDLLGSNFFGSTTTTFQKEKMMGDTENGGDIVNYSYNKNTTEIIEATTENGTTIHSENFDFSLAKAIDVFSFSIILWEFFHPSEFPWKNKTDKDIARAVISGERPEITNLEIPEFWRTMMTQCWEHLPKNRPTFEDILRMIENYDFKVEESKIK